MAPAPAQLHAPQVPRLHVLTDDDILARPDLVPVGRALLALGVALHLRGWRTSVRSRLQLAEALLAPEDGAPPPRGMLQINDRVDLALALRARQPGGASARPAIGVHLPEAAFPAQEARALLGAGVLLGRSVHGPHAEPQLDYLLVGTLFATPSHPGRPGAGWDRLEQVVAQATTEAEADSVGRPLIPILGIGGMTAERAREVRRRGGWGVAALRGVWEPSDGRAPVAAAQALLEALDERTTT